MTQPLTVACVWVNGHVPFTIDYVTRLHTMVARHLSRPFKFVTLTDRPWELPAFCGPIEIPKPASGVFGWWSKMELFNPANELSGRVLYLDLDTLVVDSLDPIVDYPAWFALAPHAGNFKPLDGRCVYKRFNSSVMAWDAAACAHIWRGYAKDDTFSRATWHKALWGDQDFLGLMLDKQAAAMPLEWFPRLSEIATADKYDPDIHRALYFKGARVVLCKKPKNHVAAQRWPWFNKLWG